MCDRWYAIHVRMEKYVSRKIFQKHPKLSKMIEWGTLGLAPYSMTSPVQQLALPSHASAGPLSQEPHSEHITEY